MNNLRFYIDLLNEDTAEETANKLATDYPNSSFNPIEEYQWALNNLKISNRIDWFVSILKYMFLLNKQEKGEELNKKENRNLEKAQSVLGEWRLGTPNDNLSKQTLNKFKDSFIHFYGFPYDKIQQYKFQFNQPIESAFNELNKLEEEYFSKQDNEKGVELQPGDYWLMKFSDGLTWYYLDRGYCEEEGRSGKHCGNIAGKRNTYERLLSLRNNDNQVQMTFSLDPREGNNILGEMKAKGNLHPDEKLFPYIMALLLYPVTLPKHFKLKVEYNTKNSIVIKGFDSQRRIPGIDFSVFNLSSEDQLYLDEYKPELVKAQIKITPVEILHADKKIQKEYLSDLPKYMQLLVENPNNVDNWLNAVSVDPTIIIHVPQILWNNYPLYIETLVNILKEDYMLLTQAPKTISKNYDILKKLIQKNPYAIDVVSFNIKEYEELCKFAVNIKPHTIEYIPEQKRTFDICYISVLKNSKMIEHVPTTLPQYEDLCLIAINTDASNFTLLSPVNLTQKICNLYFKKGGRAMDIPDNFRTKEMYMQLIDFHPLNILKISDKKPFYLELMKFAISIEPSIISKIPLDSLNYLDLVNYAISLDPTAINYIPNTTTNYITIIKSIIKNKNIKEIMNYANLESIVAMIKINPNNIEFLPPRISEYAKQELYKIAIKYGYKEKPPQKQETQQIIEMAKKIANF